MHPRRSTRAKSRRELVSEAHEDDDGASLDVEQDNDQDEYKEKARRIRGKRRKTGVTSTSEIVHLPVRRARGTRGALKDMADMPLDVIYEIFSHLFPLDLLHLARTSKGLRGILMDVSSKPFWKAARQNICDMPDCPDDMSEPMYANLAFETFCHECLRPNAGKTCWVYRFRMCKHCFEFGGDHPCHRNLNCFVFSACLSLPIPIQALTSGRRFNFPRRITEPYHEEYDALTSNEERAAYMEELERKYMARDGTAREIRSWEAERATQRSAELDAIRDQRFTDIMKKLQELGWSAELDPDCMSLISIAKEVRKPHRLTERAWPKVMEEILPVLEEFRIRRLQQIRNDRRNLIGRTYGQYKATLPPGSILPPLSEVLGMPEFQVVMDRPSDVEVTSDDCEVGMSVLPEYIALWRADAVGKLVAILNEHPAFAGSATESTIIAAPIRFKCLSCELVCSSNSFWTHHCFCPFPSTEYPLNERWVGSFRFDRVCLSPAYETAKRVCQDLGLDPNIPDHEMVDQKDHFIPLCCPIYHDGFKTWENLMWALNRAPCCLRFRFAFSEKQ